MMRGAARATIAFLAAGLLLIRSAPTQETAPPAAAQAPAGATAQVATQKIPFQQLAAPDGDRPQVVRALLDRSRLLQDARFKVPQSLFREFLRETGRQPGEPSDAPVPFIAESGTYRVSIGADRQARVQAEVTIRVFDSASAGMVHVLHAALPWENVTVNGKPANLASADGWLLMPAPPPAGPDGPAGGPPDGLALFAISADAPLAKAGPSGGAVALDICRTARTLVFFDSPLPWQVQADPLLPPIAGSAEKGSLCRIALSPRTNLKLDYRPPEAHSEHASRYELRGDIAWNLDPAVQQVSAILNVTIAGGPSDRIELLLPDRAARVTVGGPEVRQVQLAPGSATVNLRGRVLGSTLLRVSYELPATETAGRDFGRLGVADGYWLGGTLAVSAGGGAEVLPDAASGLRELPLSDLPRSTAAMLTGPPALAYQIAARDFSLSVEELQLGQFALKQSIADMAHYEVFLDRDGSVLAVQRNSSSRRSLVLAVAA